jgi:hypothetical protein
LRNDAVGGDVSISPNPPGIALPFGAIARFRSRYSVRDSRFAVFTTMRSSGSGPARRRSAEQLPRLGLPFRVFRDDPAGVLRGSGIPPGVFLPFDDIRVEVH